MKKILLLTATFFIASTIEAQLAPSTLQINTEAKIDSTGNAIFEMKGKLTAQQWITWNYMYGGGQASMVKRNIERAVSPYYVYDFKYVPNEMDRSFEVEYRAKGVVEYLGKDKWIASLGLRDIQPSKLTETTFNCVTSQATGNGGVLQNNMKYTLPSDATNMQFDKDEFGNVTVLYNRPTETTIVSGSKNMQTAGYSLIGAGLLSLIGIMVFRKKL